LTFLQTEDIPIPRALLRIPGLKKPERLPQYLTDEQVRALSMDFENRLLRAIHPHQRRDANLDRAVFYLLWQGAMRKSEVEELRLEDLDLSHRRLTVRNGKGMVDRTVYLSDTVIRSLVTYLAVRGIGPTSHVFLYRNQPLCKDLVHTRMKAAGERVGVKLHAHRLRHTCATQLLNSGCPVTSIQKIMGHKELNTTMIYARAYDATVEADYFAAMDRVEQRLQLAGIPVTKEEPVGEEERSRLRTLAEQLFMPEMSFETRRNLALQMCSLLEMHAPVSLDWLPPPVLVKSTID
jgi:integrase